MQDNATHSRIPMFEFAAFVVAVIGFWMVGRFILPEIIGEVEVRQEAAPAVIGESMVGRRAPAFSLPDMTGNRRTLSAYYGVPTVLIFFAAWNAESADQIRIMDDYAYRQAAQAGYVHLVAIGSQEDPSVTKSFVRRGGYGAARAIGDAAGADGATAPGTSESSIDILLDQYGDATSRYGVRSLPTAYFISREGVVQDAYAGIVSERAFVEKVDRLLRADGVQ